MKLKDDKKIDKFLAQYPDRFTNQSRFNSTARSIIANLRQTATWNVSGVDNKPEIVVSGETINSFGKTPELYRVKDTVNQKK